MSDQVGATTRCNGKEYDYAAWEYIATGCGPHGLVVYTWDVERFLKGLEPLD